MIRHADLEKGVVLGKIIMGVETALSFLIPTLFFAHHFFIIQLTLLSVCLVVTQLPDV